MADPQTSGAQVEHGHEPSLPRVKGLVILGIGLTILLVGSTAGMLALHFALQPKATPAPKFPGPEQDIRFIPPAPRLLVAPAQEFNEYFAEQETWLESYGWVDAENGLAHIPIRRAIDVVAERGLPAWIGAGGTTVTQPTRPARQPRELPR